MASVLHILDHSLPLHSGYSFRSQNILRAQSHRGYPVAVVTSPKHEASWKRETAAVEEIGGVRYYRTGPTRPSRFPFVGEMELIDALARRVESVAAIERPEILHAHSPVLAALAALRVGKKLRLPVVYEIRAFWEDAAVDHGTYAEGSWKYRLTRFVETWACRRASQITVLCKGLEDDLASRGIPRERMAIVPNGINLEDFGDVAPDEEFRALWGLGGRRVVAFIGSFYRYEGLDLLVRAFASLRSGLPDVKLLLVGGGEMERELRAEIDASGLTDSVVLAGRIPHERVPGVYALADILAYPRYSMRLTELVTPLKPLEAMAMGKALVASNVGGHRDLIEDGMTGVLFEAGDAGALEASLASLLADPERRRRIERAGKSWAREQRSWERTTAVYAEVYAKALERSAAPGTSIRSST